MSSRLLGEAIASGGGLIQTGPFGSQLHQRDYADEGVPVVMPKDIVQGVVDWVTVARISEHKAATLTRHRLRAGDIVLPRRGDISKCALISAEDEGALCGTGCLKIEPPPGQLDSRFFYYYLRTPTAVGWLERNAVGSTMLNLSTSIVERLPIPDIDIVVQQKIAQTLYVYDSLIENNRRRVALLENATRLLYREWFVQRRFPGHEHAKIVESLPEGWDIGTIGSVCREFIDGDWIESKDQSGDALRLLQVSNIGEEEFVETGNYRYISDETLRNLRCTEVLPGDVLISRMPTPIGRAWFVTQMPWRMVTAVDVTIARPDPGRVNVWYYLYYLNSKPHLALCEAKATGTTRLRIARKTMADLPIIIPTRELQQQFGEFAEASHRAKTVLRRQNEALERARDLLLPQLMSGELVV